MILDKKTQLSSAQAVTAADAYSTDTFDAGNTVVKRRLGAGEPVSLVVVVTTAAAASGASFTNTFDFMLVQSVNADLTSHDVIAQRRVPAVELTAGAIVVVDMPPDRPTKQFVGARYELGTGDTISVSAWLLPRSFVQAFIAYAKNYVV